MSDSSEAWLETVVAEAEAAGCDSPSQTIEPGRRPRVSDAEALLGELTSGPGELVLVETLGSGGMATIWLARQGRLDREVAVKSLRDDRYHPELAVELIREARITGGLEHPNIVPIHDIVSGDAGRPQVVMKRIAGTTWGELLASDERAPHGDIAQLRRDIEILIQVGNAIRFAHARGIIHRDLKPANVMIGEFGEVYVVDWGLAIASGARPGLAGTPAYMAPEMLGDGAPVDARTDVYLFGGLLLELACGRPPHPGKNLVGALEHVRSGAVAIPAELPGELAAICRRALARDPDERHATVDELIAELRSFLDHLSSSTLAAEAGRSLDRLRELLAGESPDREQVYNLFGECRFGFRAALAAWPDNPEAGAGIDRAFEAIVEHELARGDAGAASALLAEHPSPPGELRDRVERAAETRAARVQQLEKLEADFDPAAGRLPRLVTTLIASVLWVGLPVVLALADFEAQLSRERFYDVAIAISGGWTAVYTVIGFALRPRLERTRFNDVVVWGVWCGAAGTALAMIAARFLELDVAAAPVVALVVWASVTGVLAVALDARIAVVAIAYVAAVIVSLVAIELRWWVAALGNAAVTATALWTWGYVDRKLE